ncbi:MAG: hypothetical protein ABSC51_04825 [Gaiellaceae bacterium]|jgi:hypothetical protein
MAAKNQRADKQKAKEKREKIILAGLVAVLIVVGVIEIPSILKKKTPPASAAPATTQTAGTSSTPSTVGTPSATGVPAASGASPNSLPSSPVYKAGEGQLSAFSLFANKAPFGGAPGSQTTAASTTSTTGTNNTTTTGAHTTTTTPTGGYSTAIISVNGVNESVALDASFPAASPVFTLDSISANSIVISVAGGSFASGQPKVTIRKGRTVVLVNTVDGTRYALKLVMTGESGTFTIPGTTTSGSTTTTTGTTSTTGP